MDRNLALELARVTEAAALACGRWVGKGDKIAADDAATEAMRRTLDSLDIYGTVVIRLCKHLIYQEQVRYGL